MLFLCGGIIRKEKTIQTFTRERELFECIAELYCHETREQRKRFWWTEDDLTKQCPQEIQEFLSRTQFQGVRDWSGVCCFYKKENGVISYGILYSEGNVATAPFNQLYRIDEHWYYYLMDGTLI